MRARAAMLLLVIGCEAQPPVPPALAGSVMIANQSQYLLEELRLHQRPKYLDAPNMHEGGLGIDEEILFYGEGDWYVTALRERYRNGPILAFTTSRPVTIARERGYRLTVFDESFRLEDSTWLDPETIERPYYGEPYPLGRPADAGTGD